MNICFYTSFGVSPTQGGTERITSTVARCLTNIFGCKCYSLYSADARTGDVSDVFVGSVKISNFKKNEDRLKDVLSRWKIDVLINQGDFDLSAILSRVLKELNAHYVFCHHFEPGWELNFISVKGLVNTWKDKPTFKNFVKAWLYPYWKIKRIHSLPKVYHQTYHMADKVVLLSVRFIPQFMEYGHIEDRQKFNVIYNSLSFDSFYDKDKLDSKEKVVLIVSRMDETQKKISHALKIWNGVEKSGKCQGWTLRLVGDGPDLVRYRQYAADRQLKHVVFEGAHSPEESYRRASLFMMTSESEGWGLTLTEAQQNGCVPLAFDTYVSLHEIITDGYNGQIIPKGDLQKYAEQLERLMTDDGYRKQLAAQAIESSHRFEQKVIARQWYDLLTNTITNP